MKKQRKRLINLRKEIDLTHEEIANKLGISRSYYTMIENGNRNPSLNVAIRIANLFNADVSEIFLNT